jgi:hypothetical protein
MSNGFQNPVMYTSECLFSLVNELVFTKHVDREYDDKFAHKGAQIGDTINIRRPARYTVSSGSALSTQDYTETSIPLTINSQKHIDTTFTSVELTLKVEDFAERVIKPKMIQLANQIDQDGLNSAAVLIGNLTGTAGTSPNNISFVTAAGKQLDDFSAPRDGERYLLLDTASNASMINALSGFFNDPRLVSSQYKDAVFVDGTNTIGFKIGMSQNVFRQTMGPRGGTPAVNGAAQGLTAGWANTGTLVTNGWTAAAAQRVAAGDIFTIAGVNSVNPVTRQSTGQPMQFVVLGNQSSDGAGNLTLNISPAIISAGPFQNVTAAPGNGALLTFVGTASTAYARNLAWHKSAFTLGCVDLVDVSDLGAWGARRQWKGISLRVVRQYAIATDTVPARVDVLYGWAAPYPELASQLIAA